MSTYRLGKETEAPVAVVKMAGEFTVPFGE